MARVRAVPTVVGGVRYRSKMEARLAPALTAAGGEYEKLKLPYTAERVYTPDWVLPNGVVVEIKGRFTAADRTKMLAVSREHPLLDIRFILATPDAYLTKARRATQGSWCLAHGFAWAKNELPASWLV